MMSDHYRYKNFERPDVPEVDEGFAAQIRRYVHENPFEYDKNQLAETFDTHPDTVVEALKSGPENLTAIPKRARGNRRYVWGFSKDVPTKLDREWEYLGNRCGKLIGDLRSIRRRIREVDRAYEPELDDRAMELREMIQAFSAALPPQWEDFE